MTAPTPRSALRFVPLLLLGSVHAQTLSPEQLFDRVSPSVWLVKTQDAAGKPVGLGSGVVTGAETLITNCHVLKGARAAFVSWEATTLAARLEHSDPERDLCQFRVSGMTAPPVPMAPPASLRVGARVYAIGNPRGLELTMSEGIVSGLRRSAGEVEAVQTTAPISPGSSGGGLFDSEGRLIGITTFQLRDSQNLNFAIPARWITEVEARSQTRLARRSAPAPAAPPVAAAPAASASPSPTTPPAVAARTSPAPAFDDALLAGGGAQALVGRTLVHRLTNRISRMTQTVLYKADRIEGDQLIFNDGSRIESLRGEIITVAAQISGEYDLAMPPGGWVPKLPEMGGVWKVKFSRKASDFLLEMDLTARVQEEGTLRIAGRDLRVIRVAFNGFTNRNLHGASVMTSRASYVASAWYSPELGRVVRFDMRCRGGQGGGMVIEESLELVEIRAS